MPGPARARELSADFERPILPKRRKLPPPDVSMAIKLDRWEWEYGIGYNFFEDHENLREEATLVLNGVVEVTTAERFLGLPVTVRADGVARGNVGDNSSFFSRRLIGDLQRGKSGFSGGFWMPLDMLPVVLSLLRSEQYPYLALSLWNVGHPHYDIKDFSFRHSKPQPDDL